MAEVRIDSECLNSKMLNFWIAPRPGEVMRFPDLAQTFKALVAEGKDGFYKGRVAQVLTPFFSADEKLRS